MATWRINNSTALGGEVCSPWQAGHAYTLGARCVCTVAYATTTRRAYVYECTTAGNSHATTQPVWPTSGTIADGPDTLVWTTRNPNDGNWDNASCYLHYVSYHAVTAAGDFIYVDDSHSEVSALAAYIEGATTRENPIKFLCVDKATDALSTGALISSTSTGTMNFTGYGYSYGIQYKSAGSFTINTEWVLESNGGDVLFLNRTTAASIWFDGYVRILNGGINLADPDLYLYLLNGTLEWRGGTLTAPGGVKALVWSAAGSSGNAYFYEVDLSAIGNGDTKILFKSSVAQTFRSIVQCTRCKISSNLVPCAAWVTGNLSRVIMHGCSDQNRTYDFYEESYEGILQDNTSIYANAGSITPDSTNFSISMVSSATTLDLYYPFESIPIACWTNSTGAKTFTIEGVWDSAANIENDEIWAVFDAPSSNASGLGQRVSTRCAPLGTPADVTASAASWTGTGGFANENKFKIQATITPGKVGPITARVYLAKANTTVYIDAKITES